jgi:hypothetical protein
MVLLWSACLGLFVSFFLYQAMYCTGGIRCESASSFLRECARPADVVQLRGYVYSYVLTRRRPARCYKRRHTDRLVLLLSRVMVV